MHNTNLTDCQRDKIKELCGSFGNDPGELIHILHRIQDDLGYLPEEVQREVGKNLKIPVAKVYGVVSFYSFFTMTPKGRHPISVCMGTACYVRGAEKIVDEIKEKLNIEVGGVTLDGRFSLDCLRCVGACGLAPVMLIGDKVYGRLTEGQVSGIIESYNHESGI